MSKNTVVNEKNVKPNSNSRAVYCISTDVPPNTLGTGKSLAMSIIHLLNSKVSN